VKFGILAILGAVSHFGSHNDEIWREGAELALPPHAKFCIKKSSGADLYQKFHIFANFGALRPLV